MPYILKIQENSTWGENQKPLLFAFCSPSHPPLIFLSPPKFLSHPSTLLDPIPSSTMLQHPSHPLFNSPFHPSPHNPQFQKATPPHPPFSNHLFFSSPFGNLENYLSENFKFKCYARHNTLTMVEWIWVKFQDNNYHSNMEEKLMRLPKYRTPLLSEDLYAN